MGNGNHFSGPYFSFNMMPGQIKRGARGVQILFAVKYLITPLPPLLICPRKLSHKSSGKKFRRVVIISLMGNRNHFLRFHFSFQKVVV
eukprot:UN05178